MIRSARLGVVILLGLMLGTPAPSEARPQTRGHAVAKPTARTRAPQARAKAKTKTKPKARVVRTAAPRISIAGTPRPDREQPGRRPSLPTSPAERTADAIDAVLRGPLRFGTTGLYVVDAATGAELFAVHADDPLNPASNVKLISTATALDAVGPAFRYQTRVLGVPPDRDGVITGSVYLHGSYDPTLAAAHLDELAAAIAARGVVEIRGDVVVGEQPTRDGIYRPRLRVEVIAGAPGEAPTVTVGPATDFVEIVNQATTSKRAKVKRKAGLTFATALVDVDGQPHLRITVDGAIGKGKTEARVVTTKERARFTAHVLRAALARAGVTVTGAVRTAALEPFVAETGVRLPTVLATHASAPLADIVAMVNKRSINWLADRVLTTTVALAHGTRPDLADGIDAMYGWLDARSAIARSTAVIDTGSGLSYRTELSPRQLVNVVRVATGTAPPPTDEAAACAAAFRHSLSVAGVDGTLRGRFRSSLRGRVIGKTGTLTGVIALSGLLESADGRTLAFSLVSNGHPAGRKLSVRAAHEQILGELDRYLLATAPVTAAPAPQLAPTLTPPTAPTADPADDELDDDDGAITTAPAGE